MQSAGTKTVASSVIDRLIDAINAHDIEALTACFVPAYSVTWPAYPARSFTGREHVRSTWEALFKAYPSIEATVTARVHSGDEIWAEWEFKSESAKDDHPQFWQRGVIVVAAEGDVIGSARFYMEPVEAADS